MSLRRAMAWSRLLALAAAICFAAAAPNIGWSGEAWRGKYFPNVGLTTQDNKKIKFYDDVLKNKVVAINFIYTTCPDVCPMDTAKLRQVQDLLGKRVGKDIFFYSITIDPKNDTPAALRSYKERYDIAPGWEFLTGTEADIALIQKKFGYAVSNAANARQHSTSIMFGNEKNGRWIKRSPHDNAQLLADVLVGLVKEGRSENAGGLNYSAAQTLAPLGKGESLFRTRCASCHSIGSDGLGPDLDNVSARRTKAWLTRWIMEPDRMLAEGDPIAVAQYKAYREVAMPNFKLSASEAAALIDFIDLESRERRAKSAHEGHIGH